MKTYYVKDLDKGLVLTNETFAVKYFEQGTTKDGKAFYKLILLDKTGEIKAQVWNDKIPNIEKGALSIGAVARISGTVEDFRGILQINIFTAQKVNESQLDEYLEASDFDAEELWAELQTKIAALKAPEFHSFFAKLFGDKEIVRKYKTYPAAVYVHHSFQSGLLEHVVEMLEIAEPLKRYYPEANYDLVTAGIIMHDIGKLSELEPNGVVVQQTKEGMLVGHLIKSFEVVHDFGTGVLSADQLLQLKHIILSHHGQLEFGSPILPATIEAAIVSQVDYLSSRTRIYQRLIRKHEGSDVQFTEYEKLLGTKIFVGSNIDPE